MADWDKIASRGRVEDRRGLRATALGGGVSVMGIALFLLLTYAMGGDMGDVVSQIPEVIEQTGGLQMQQSDINTSEFEGLDEYEQFASAVLGSANDLWRREFAEAGRSYTEPTLVLFRQATQSGCGFASSQIGQHYCPNDNTIYLDETFFDELTRRFGARGGDVAEAYVIAHEVGHHVQNELGLLDQMRREQERNPKEANELSVGVELRADCYAGMWANSIRDQGVFEPNEIREAMDAAAAVGDDRIQEATTGQVNPESWTHGSAEQRMRAFNIGYETGSFERCNAF